MRILLVSHELTLTGAPASLLRHAKYLQEAGHELAVWSFRDGPLGQSFRALGLPPRILGQGYEALRAACDASAPNVDLALCNTIVTWRCAELLHARGVPVAWFVRETCKLDLWYAEKPAFAKFFRTFPGLYCPSARTAEVIRLYNPTVRVIRDSIDDSFTQYAPLGEKVRFGYIGSIIRPKGVDLLTEAFLRFHRRHPGVTLRLAGDTNRPLGHELTRRTADVPEIIWQGSVQGEAKKSFFDAIDVLFVPSLEEAFGLTVLEGAMYGKVVVATDRIGASDIVAGQGGALVRAGNRHDLERAMDLFATMRPEELRRRQEAMRESFLKGGTTIQERAGVLRMVADLAVPSRQRPPLSVDLRREAPRPVTLPYFLFATIRRLYWSLRLLPKGRGPWSQTGRCYLEKGGPRPQSWLSVRLQVLKQKMSFWWGGLPPWISARRLDLLVPVHIDEPNLRNIGDLHFARAMRRELTAIGYRVRLVPLELWGWRTNARYVIRLKGLYDYTPRRRRGVRHVMWCISHPDMLTNEECDRYDCVLFASKRMADAFAPRLHTRTGVLLQAADEVALARDGTPTGDPDLLFVANSRGVYRQIIRDLLPTKYNLAIYGQGWEGMPAEPFVRSNGANYDEVGDLYHNAKIVLNDHWDDMRQWGIVSNRCFDVLAAGGFVLSDHLPELAEVFGGTVVTYHSPGDLREKVRHYLEHPEERRALSEKGRRLVLSAHTFRHRMRQLHEVLLSLEADRGNATTKGAHGC